MRERMSTASSERERKTSMIIMSKFPKTSWTTNEYGFVSICFNFNQFLFVRIN